MKAQHLLVHAHKAANRYGRQCNYKDTGTLYERAACLASAHDVASVVQHPQVEASRKITQLCTNH